MKFFEHIEDTELLTKFNSKQADLDSRRIVCRIDGKRYAAALQINALHSAPACRNWNKSPAFVSPFVCHEDFAVCNARSATCLCRCEYLPPSDLNRGYGITAEHKGRSMQSLFHLTPTAATPSISSMFALAASRCMHYQPIRLIYKQSRLRKSIHRQMGRLCCHQHNRQFFAP